VRDGKQICLAWKREKVMTSPRGQNKRKEFTIRRRWLIETRKRLTSPCIGKPHVDSTSRKKEGQPGKKGRKVPGVRRKRAPAG